MNKELILTCSADISKLNTSQGYFPHTVSCIKAIRTIALNGLKEAKDGWDSMRAGESFKIEIKNDNTALVDEAIKNLRVWGVIVAPMSSPREVVILELKRNVKFLLDGDDYTGAIEIINTIRRLSGE